MRGLWSQGICLQTYLRRVNLIMVEGCSLSSGLNFHWASWWKSAKQHCMAGESFLQGTWTLQQLLQSDPWNTINRACINTVRKEKQLCACCVGARTQPAAHVLQITSLLSIHAFTCSQLSFAPCTFLDLYSCTITIKMVQFYNCWLCNLCKSPLTRQSCVNG